jgi:hypothetical protein
MWQISEDIVASIVPHEKHSGRLASFSGTSRISIRAFIRERNIPGSTTIPTLW